MASVADYPVVRQEKNNLKIYQERLKGDGAIYDVVKYFADQKADIEEDLQHRRQEQDALHKNLQFYDFNNLRNKVLIDATEAWTEERPNLQELTDAAIKDLSWSMPSEERTHATDVAMDPYMQRTLKDRFRFFNKPRVALEDIKYKVLVALTEGKTIPEIQTSLSLAKADNTVKNLSRDAEAKYALKRLLQFRSIKDRNDLFRELSATQAKSLFFFLMGKEAIDIAREGLLGEGGAQSNRTITNNLLKARHALKLDNKGLRGLRKAVLDKAVEDRTRHLDLNDQDRRLLAFVYGDALEAPNIQGMTKSDLVAVIKAQKEAVLTETQQGYLDKFIEQDDVGEKAYQAVAEASGRTITTVRRILYSNDRSAQELLEAAMEEVAAEKLPSNYKKDDGSKFEIKAKDWFSFKQIDRDLIRLHLDGLSYTNIREQMGPSKSYVRETYLDDLFTRAKEKFGFTDLQIQKAKEVYALKSSSAADKKDSFFSRVFDQKPKISYLHEKGSTFEHAIFSKALALTANPQTEREKNLTFYIQGKDPKWIADRDGKADQTEKDKVTRELHYDIRKLRRRLQVFIKRNYLKKTKPSAQKSKTIKTRFLQGVFGRKAVAALRKDNDELYRKTLPLLAGIKSNLSPIFFKPYLEGNSPADLAKIYGEDETKVKSGIDKVFRKIKAQIKKKGLFDDAISMSDLNFVPEHYSDALLRAMEDRQFKKGSKQDLSYLFDLTKDDTLLQRKILYKVLMKMPDEAFEQFYIEDTPLLKNKSKFAELMSYVARNTARNSDADILRTPKSLYDGYSNSLKRDFEDLALKIHNLAKRYTGAEGPRIVESMLDARDKAIVSELRNALSI